MLAALALLLASGAACSETPLAQVDEIFYSGDARRMFCAASLDSSAENDLASVVRGLERARARGEVIGLYGHIPGSGLPWDKLEAVLAKAAELELDFVTYAELGPDSAPGGGVVLSFDDAAVAEWHAARPLFDRYGAKVTFFVTRYDLWSADQRVLLHELAADGHAIEAHGLRHVNGPAYVTEYGLAAFMDDEVVPILEALRADGFHPTVYAYPYGKRTSEIDVAVLRHVDKLRSTSIIGYGVVQDPCPE